MTNSIRVEVIRTRAGTSLVQWSDNGAPARAFVPATSIVENKVDQLVLWQGLPYGAPWAALCPENGDDIERELHKAGIWTGDDLRNRLEVAKRAIYDSFGDILKTLLEATANAKPGV